jgi:hypothetical protein
MAPLTGNPAAAAAAQGMARSSRLSGRWPPPVTPSGYRPPGSWVLRGLVILISKAPGSVILTIIIYT